MKKSPEPPFQLRRAPLQRAIWTTLAEAGGPLKLEEIAERLGGKWPYGSIKTKIRAMTRGDAPYLASLPGGFYALPEHLEKGRSGEASHRLGEQGDVSFPPAEPNPHSLDTLRGNPDTPTPPPGALPRNVQDLLLVVDSVRYSKGEAIVLGPAIRDRRVAPTLDNGRLVRFEDAVVPSNALRSMGLTPGDRMDLQPCAGFVTAGIYVVIFNELPDLYYVAPTPNAGFVFKNDQVEFFVDPDPGGETGWRERGSGQPARFRFFRRLLRATQTFAVPEPD